MKIAYVLLCSSIYLLQSNAQISLGSAASFALLGASEITSTGPSIINGDVGVYPSTSIVISSPGIVTGTVYSAGAVAKQAQTDIFAAYGILAGRTVTQILSGTDLGGLTLGAGVYYFGSSAGLTGILTLSGGGRTDGIFVFQIASTLIAEVASSVVLISGAQACNVYWQVGSSATLNTGTQFIGNILADQSITLAANANNNGGLFALHAAIVLDSSTVNVALCAVISPSSSLPIIPSTTITTVVGSVTTTTTTTSIPLLVSTAPLVSSYDVGNIGSSGTMTTLDPKATTGSGSSGGNTPVIIYNTSGGVAPVETVSIVPGGSISPGNPPTNAPGVSTEPTIPGTQDSSGVPNLPDGLVNSPNELAALIQGAPGEFANELISALAAASNSPAGFQNQLISSIIANAFAAASLAPLQSENDIISALETALNAPAEMQNGLISSIIKGAFASSSTAALNLDLATFLVNCTTVPSTLYTYEQTFTLNELGITTITCPISTQVSHTLVTVTVECTSVPTTLTTHNQTFTILETGMATITCPLASPTPTATEYLTVEMNCTSFPLKMTSYEQIFTMQETGIATITCTNTAIIAAAAKTISSPKATSSCTTSRYTETGNSISTESCTNDVSQDAVFASPTRSISFAGKSAGPSSYSVAAIFFSYIIFMFLLF